MRKTIKQVLDSPQVRGFLDYYKERERQRKVLEVCSDCSFEITNQDTAPHTCPPEVGP